MRSLLDLFFLLTESIQLALKEGLVISSAWTTAAAAAAGAAFFLCGFFCRLWNRYYQFTAVHLASFSLAAFLSAYGVLLWPGSVKLESAMTNRIQQWQYYLLSGEVEVNEAIIELARKSQVEALVQSRNTIPWISYMGLELRKVGVDLQVEQKPDTFGSVYDPEGDSKPHEKDFELTTNEFSRMSPYLYTRAGQAFTTEQSQAYAEKAEFERLKSVDPHTGLGGGIPYTWITETIGHQIAAALTPQAGQLAYWTRIVGVIGCFAAILLPGLISGFVSYLQIDVDKFASPRRGKKVPTVKRK